MITLSEYVVIGLLEVFAILLLVVCALMIYNHKLHKRGTSLATQMHQLKDTTRFLLDKVNEFGKISYASFLGDELGPAKVRVTDFFVDEELHFQSEQSCDDKAAIMRYMLLEAELAAEEEIDETAKEALRNGKLNEIVSDFEQASGPTTIPTTESAESSIDEADLKQKWGYLCDAALSLIKQRSFQAEDDLIDIIRVINTDLELERLDVPERGEVMGSNNQTVELVRQEADRSREVITKLLSERNAAEAEINIKAEELEKLQRFLKESEVCMGLLESELHESNKNLELIKKASDQDPIEMQALIQRFSHESSEMLLCIETLEKENSELKSQLGLG